MHPTEHARHAASLTRTGDAADPTQPKPAEHSPAPGLAPTASTCSAEHPGRSHPPAGTRTTGHRAPTSSPPEASRPRRQHRQRRWFRPGLPHPALQRGPAQSSPRPAHHWDQAPSSPRPAGPVRPKLRTHPETASVRASPTHRGHPSRPCRRARQRARSRLRPALHAGRAVQPPVSHPSPVPAGPGRPGPASGPAPRAPSRRGRPARPGRAPRTRGLCGAAAVANLRVRRSRSRSLAGQVQREEEHQDRSDQRGEDEASV